MFKYFHYNLTQSLVNIPKDVPFQISAMYVHQNGFPYPCKVLDILDYHRRYVCIRTDVYPLMWIFWLGIKKLIDFNRFFQGQTYWFLRNFLNGGKDYVPEIELCGGWKAIFRHFWTYKINQVKVKASYLKKDK